MKKSIFIFAVVLIFMFNLPAPNLTLLVGKKTSIIKHNALKSETFINFAHLNQGIYFVKISTDIGDVVKKIVKQ